MKVKEIIKESKKNWIKVSNNNPAFMKQGQTKVSYSDYNKLIKIAEDFDNSEFAFCEVNDEN